MWLNDFPSLSGQNQPTLAEFAKLWLEKEKPDETKKIEELKQKRKEREKARSGQQNQQQKSQPFEDRGQARTVNSIS